MINESYIEVMVKRKTSFGMNILRMVAFVSTGLFLLLALIGFTIAFLPAAACGVAAYFLNLYTTVEYEYTYVDKELQIDRILARSKRKRMDTLDLTQMEIMAPMGSHQLDSYRHRTDKRMDYSSGEEKKPEARYLLYMNNRQVVIEPGEDMVKMIQSIAPRKVFTY